MDEVLDEWRWRWHWGLLPVMLRSIQSLEWDVFFWHHHDRYGFENEHCVCFIDCENSVPWECAEITVKYDTYWKILKVRAFGCKMWVECDNLSLYSLSLCDLRCNESESTFIGKRSNAFFKSGSYRQIHWVLKNKRTFFCNLVFWIAIFHDDSCTTVQRRHSKEMIKWLSFQV